MPITDDVVGVVIPNAIILPVKDGADQSEGKAGNIFISGGKILFNPTDGGAPETVTST